MRINFLQIAQIELDDAIDYYNYEVPGGGLGDAFLTEVLNALDRIGEFPEAWHRINSDKYGSHWSTCSLRGDGL
jgi:heme oxygenase